MHWSFRCWIRMGWQAFTYGPLQTLATRVDNTSYESDHMRPNLLHPARCCLPPSRRVLAQGRAASSPQDVAAQEKSFERQLRKDALRKRVMMKMVPNAEQVRGRETAHAEITLDSLIPAKASSSHLNLPRFCIFDGKQCPCQASPIQIEASHVRNNTGTLSKQHCSLLSHPGPDPTCAPFPPPSQVITCLKSSDMLPAIWFILSRQGCDQAALAAGLDVSLTTVDEQAQIMAEIRELRWESGWGAVCTMWGCLVHTIMHQHMIFEQHTCTCSTIS